MLEEQLLRDEVVEELNWDRKHPGSCSLSVVEAHLGVSSGRLIIVERKGSHL